jgi:hypothetical protein
MGRGSLLLPSSSLCWPRSKRVVDRAQISCCLPRDLKPEMHGECLRRVVRARPAHAPIKGNNTPERGSRLLPQQTVCTADQNSREVERAPFWDSETFGCLASSAIYGRVHAHPTPSRNHWIPLQAQLHDCWMPDMQRAGFHICAERERLVQGRSERFCSSRR